MSLVAKKIKKLHQNRWNISKSSAQVRIQKLKKLRTAVLENRESLYEALYNDFHKSHVETELTEIQPVIAELNFHIKKLKRWMKPHKVKTPLRLMGTKSYIVYEPKGTVAIISPWNYPFHLTMVPLISAIAAGNCVAVKPSDATAHTSKNITLLIKKVFSEDEVVVIEGNADKAKELLEEKFDHIFFTGSVEVGKIVMEAAAKHLSSVTLELGGKTPAIIDSSAELKNSVERIIWGKYMNAGQTCVAPDYVYVQESQLDLFLEYVSQCMEKFYKKSSESICRIVNEKHWKRLTNLLSEVIDEGGKIEFGGSYDEATKYISPTVVSNVKLTSNIMQQEIFGPILPIITYNNIQEIIPFLQRSKPLSMFIFSRNKENTKNILNNTTAGGSCVNNVAIYLGNPYLPFGGANSSGIGNYHGFFGFQTFSQTRAVLYQGIFCGLSFIYPPYTKNTKKLAQWVTNYLS